MLGFSHVGQTYVAGMPMYGKINQALAQESLFLNDNTSYLRHYLVILLEQAKVNDSFSFIANFLVNISEKIDVSDSLFTQVLFLLRVVDKINISDKNKRSFMIKVIQSVLFLEQAKANLSFLIEELLEVVESVTTKRMIIAKELAALLDRISKNFLIKVIEKLDIKEELDFLRILIVRETIRAIEMAKSLLRFIAVEAIRIKDITKINGQILVYLWEACLEKGNAIVQSVYRKLRQ